MIKGRGHKNIWFDECKIKHRLHWFIFYRMKINDWFDIDGLLATKLMWLKMVPWNRSQRANSR